MMTLLYLLLGAVALLGNAILTYGFIKLALSRGRRYSEQKAQQAMLLGCLIALGATLAVLVVVSL